MVEDRGISSGQSEIGGSFQEEAALEPGRIGRLLDERRWERKGG